MKPKARVTKMALGNRVWPNRAAFSCYSGTFRSLSYS